MLGLQGMYDSLTWMSFANLGACGFSHDMHMLQHFG